MWPGRKSTSGSGTEHSYELIQKTLDCHLCMPQTCGAAMCQEAQQEAAAAKAAAVAAAATPASLLTGVVAPPEHWAPLADRSALLEMHWLPLDGEVACAMAKLDD